MGIFIACVICVMVGGAIAALLVAIAKMRMLDTRLAQLEQLVESSGIGEPIPVRVARLEAFMRPGAGELAPRLAQLEQQQAVDSRAFAEQARIHHRRIGELDERMQWMARYGHYHAALADTVSIEPIDRNRPTPVMPPQP